jgi:hypothetical protein
MIQIDARNRQTLSKKSFFTSRFTLGKRSRLLSTLLLGASFVLACGESEELNSEVVPVVEATSQAVVVVGQSLEFYGRNFLKDGEGSSRLSFTGSFTDQFGRVSSVDFGVTPFFGGQELGEDGRQILTWSRFGPFRNPFTGDARHGVFSGTVQVMNYHEDGTVEEGPSQRINLQVDPSIIIEALEPFNADCGAPAVRVIPGIPYTMKVTVTGIRATKFVYEFGQVNNTDSITQFTHEFSSEQPTAEDAVGESAEMVVFNAIPENQQSYVTGIRVVAYDDEGKFVETALPISVHRPLEVKYDGSYELAERYEPIPVSGCIPGSVGNQVSYSESTVETRTQSVSMTVSNSWTNSEGRTVSQNTNEGIAVGESNSRTLGSSSSEYESLSEGFGETYTQNESNNVNFTTTDGEGWSWNLSEGQSQDDYESRVQSIYGEASGSVGVGVSGEGSVAGFAKVSGSVETTVGVTAGTTRGSTEGTRMSTSTNRGYSMSGSSSESRGFGSSLSEGRSSSLNGTYTLGRTNGSSESMTEGMSNTRTWDFSEGTSINEVSSIGNSETISNSMVSSESKGISQSFSGYIPRGRYGIFYRQTTRWVRRAEVVSYDLCGIASHMGELLFNEWDWAPDLAIGDNCDVTPPPSNLPTARCLISPCGE